MIGIFIDRPQGSHVDLCLPYLYLPLAGSHRNQFGVSAKTENTWRKHTLECKNPCRFCRKTALAGRAGFTIGDW